MNADNSLIVSLEEFGLSKYEARAYFAMLSRGPVSAGDLAYYSDIPRTKVYPTLEKLKKKRLAIIRDTKPKICTAIAPEKAFDSPMQEKINNLNALNSLLYSLKMVSENSRRSRGIDERHYNHLASNNTLEELRMMISAAKDSVRIMVGGLGVELISGCKAQIVTALNRGVDVRMIVPPSEAGGERTDSLPACSGMRMLKQDQNIFIVDNLGILVADKNGADVLASTDTLAPGIGGMFDIQWEGAVPADILLDMTGSESEEVYRAVTALDGGGLACVLKDQIPLDPAPDLAGLLEENRVPVYSRTLKDLVDLADSSLQVVCSGKARIDMDESELSLESPAGRGHVQAWALVIDSYLKANGYQTRIISHVFDGDEKMHIRLEKS